MLKRIGVDQVEGLGGNDLGQTLQAQVTATQTAADAAQQAQNEVDLLEQAHASEVKKTNEAVVAAIVAPVSTPVFTTVKTKAIAVGDVTAGQPTVVTIPDGAKYAVGKGNMLVLRNGIPYTPAADTYTEASATTISFATDLLVGGYDVITFIIFSAPVLNYSTAVTHYASGEFVGMVETITFTGDINRVVTFEYVTGTKKISKETTVEDGKTITKTYSYTDNLLTGVAVTVA